jgi:hypothetical protein
MLRGKFINERAIATCMPADTRAGIESSLGQKAIAKTIAEAPGPIVREEDGFDGRGKEHAQAVAQS